MFFLHLLLLCLLLVLLPQQQHFFSSSIHLLPLSTSTIISSKNKSRRRSKQSSNFALFRATITYIKAASATVPVLVLGSHSSSTTSITVFSILSAIIALPKLLLVLLQTGSTRFLFFEKRSWIKFRILPLSQDLFLVLFLFRRQVRGSNLNLGCSHFSVITAYLYLLKPHFVKTRLYNTIRTSFI